MRESQQSISDWSTTTFGTDGTDLIVATRANDEFAEFLRSFSKGKPDIVEVADTTIVLVRLAARWGCNADAILGVTPHVMEPLDDLIIAATSHMAELVIAGIDRVRRQYVILQMLATLTEIATALGGDLGDEIDKKMVINRRRKWKVVDGMGYHEHEDVA